MSAIHETAYPRVKPNFTHKELSTLFTPTEDELFLLNTKTKQTFPESRLGFMLILKCYQYLGRPVNVLKIAPVIKKHIATQINIDPTTELHTYGKLTRLRHIKIIREYLRINTDRVARKKIIKAAAMDAATKKENLADIVNIILEELIKARFELPAFQKLVRISRAARVVVNNHNYNEIYSKLSEQQLAIIDTILELKPKDEQKNPQFKLSWHELKQEPKKATQNRVKAFINHVNNLKALWQQLHVDLSFMTHVRLEQLRDEALIADLDDMQSMRPIKRYALAIILVYMKMATAIDDLVEIFIFWIRKIEAQAKSALEEYRLEQAAKTDEFVVLLYQFLLALKNNHDNSAKIQAIEEQLDGKTEHLIEECKEYLGLTGENHITWMKKPYQNKRHVLFQLLENLTILSSTNDKSIENALSFIKHHQHSNREWIILEETSAIQPDLSLLSDAWYKAVTELNRNLPVKKIHRLYYELAVLQVLKNDLNCSDAYIDGAFIYDDPNKQFITWEEFAIEVDGYCDLVKLSKQPVAFVALLKERLRQAAVTVDNNYPTNNHLVIDKELPVLKKLPKKPEHPELEKFKQLVMNEMPVVSIVDVIVDVEHWLNLSAHLKPMSGYEVKIKDYPSRFVATALSYGSNMGPTQTERSLVKFSRKQIAWIFNHHVTEQKLLKVLRILINRYNLFELPNHWGSGDSESIDGSFVDIYKQNLLAAHHIRYGKYGGVGYYHVSDKYISLHANLISCGAHEWGYLLDGVIENDTDIKPTAIHGDSWAQSEVLFGIASLLAVKIMPRIKHFKHLLFYKASSSDHYININELFTEKPVDFELLETHYHDMLRVAISIFKSKVKPSTILRKLCSKSRKNKLYYAFRELGRVERTIFLLNYINDPELRRMIQAATCKSEEFNQFINWVRFGDGGMIGDNLRFNQCKIIKFSQLLANMFIFHTVVHQTKAINKLEADGINIPTEVLSGFSPYWTEHFNRFGAFPLDMDKLTAEIEYELQNPKVKK